jgi:hypothetical protein
MSYLDLIDTVFDHGRDVDHREIELLRQHLTESIKASPASDEADDLERAVVALEALSLLLRPGERKSVNI